MATPQLSPGVVVREVDLTVGRADNVLANVGAIAGPFRIGPVEEAIDITTEQELINTFGKPLSTDRQYEYWMSASSFLHMVVFLRLQEQMVQLLIMQTQVLRLVELVLLLRALLKLRIMMIIKEVTQI